MTQVWALPTVGELFEDWVVCAEPWLDDQRDRPRWRVPMRCLKCGADRLVPLDKLRQGSPRSCGCFSGRRTHGQTHTPLHQVWAGMKSRCYNENNHAYASYGGRGISVCDEWRESFETFAKWAWEAGYAEPEGGRNKLTLDRINVDGNYEPANCRWSDDVEQANNKRNNRFVTAWGETKTVGMWGRDSRAKARTTIIVRRLDLGWEPEAAISTPEGLPEKRKNAFLVTAFGETKHATEWLVDPRLGMDVDYDVIHRRISSGWSGEEAIATPLAGIIAWGERKTGEEWADDGRAAKGLAAGTIRVRIYVMGWSTEDAITRPVQDGIGMAWGETKPHKEWLKDPRSKVRSYRTLMRRLGNGMPLEEALTIEDRRTGRKIRSHTKMYEAFGEIKSRAEWVADPRCVISSTTFYQRVEKYGWDVERALTTP